MEESVFNAMAEAELARIETALEECGADMDVEPKPVILMNLNIVQTAKVS